MALDAAKQQIVDKCSEDLQTIITKLQEVLSETEAEFGGLDEEAMEGDQGDELSETQDTLRSVLDTLDNAQADLNTMNPKLLMDETA